MAVLVTLWGARLTFNFARKGGYAGRRGLPLADPARPDDPGAVPAVQPVLHRRSTRTRILVLIAFRHTRRTRTGHAVRRSTWRSPRCFLVLLAARRSPTSSSGSSTSGRRPSVAAGREPQPRFLQTGLLRVLAPPELLLRAGSVVGVLLLRRGRGAARCWSGPCSGAVLLTALFIGSTIFTESISRSKYPEYADYQASTSPIVPWFPRPRRGAVERTA